MAAEGPKWMTEQSLHTVSSWSTDLASESFVDISPSKDDVDSPAVAGHGLWRGVQTRIGSDVSSLVLINGEDSMSQQEATDEESERAPILIQINPGTPEKYQNSPELTQDRWVASEMMDSRAPPDPGMGHGSPVAIAGEQGTADSELLSKTLVASAESTPVKDQEQNISTVTSDQQDDEWSRETESRPAQQDLVTTVTQRNLSHPEDSPVPPSPTLQSTREAALVDVDRAPDAAGSISSLTECLSVNMEENWEQSNLGPADDLWTTKCDGLVRLRMDETRYGSEPPVTVHQLFQQAVQQYGDWPALAVKKDGQWETITYLQYYQSCQTAAKGFLKLGLQPYHGVGIIGFNAPEWFFSSIGAIMAGGFSAGIYTTNSPEACQYVADTCAANVLVVENHHQLTKILQIQDHLPHLKAIIQYHDDLKEKRPNLYTWKEFMQLGSDVPDSQLDEIMASQKANQCCTLIYTSGTTGNAKAVMLSHDNLTWTVKSVGKILEVGPHEVIVSYLPLNHIAAQFQDIWVPIASGGTTYFAEPDAIKGSLVTTLQEVHPTILLGVPRVWEKIHEKMTALSSKSSLIQRTVAAWAKSIGLQASYNRMNGNNYVPWGYTLANILVFKRVAAALGLDRCTRCLTGGAPISKDTLEYFMSLNMPLLELYGMSECSGPNTVSSQTAFHITSCGKEIPGSSIRIDKPDEDGNGEICFWGRHVFMGYLNMKDLTEEAIDNQGWLHSGDFGKHDEHGFLYITGRIKELIITSGGENIAPAIIEERLKEEVPIISNAMLIGDRRKFLSMLLTLKCKIDPGSGDTLDELAPEAIHFCQELGSTATRVSEVISSKDEAVYKAIQEGMDRVNRRAVSNAQKVQKWTILSKDFSIIGGELGPTMKLKRPVVLKMYKNEIEDFYQE
ncbi:long-chain-fatty-acid--CoA ligase ACSBG2 isoform X2 [Microcaecilia unicolor]|uniref:long-chain-fatty-acid--CoA ligase n=1 Tax=Microcaecilia unicolor TaxID=1415580 RepID=A0A6P7WZE9_9AMPH|nr:long-chain-fatty-acid--CoA ligase ACSBG2-like isoform X2 [Microcaecilia unicolor]